MKSSDTYERTSTLRRTLQFPMRRVVERILTNPGHPHYQEEHLECGHTLPQQSPRWRKNRFVVGGEWIWPKQRRCWKCEAEPEDTRSCHEA